MSEKTSGSFSIDTYLSKQEGLLLEHIRRMLQAETKITLLEAALQDMYKRNEELSKQNDSTQVALDQAVNGLKATTNQKNNLDLRVQELEKTIESLKKDLNSAIIHRVEAEKLTEQLNAAKESYDTLKKNYDLVLEQCNNKPVEVSPTSEKKKKLKSTESEWTDGKY